MERSELTAMLPKNRDDVESARAIVALGYPTVEPVLKSLFQWLETSSSPVELIVREFFAEIGEPALPLVREALQAQIKPARKHCLLRHVLPHWPSEVLEKLGGELWNLLQEPHGLNVWSLKLMLDKGINDRVKLLQWRELFLEDLTEQLEALR